MSDNVQTQAFDGMVLLLEGTALQGPPGEQGEGVKGQPGDSTYQTWLKQGNTGSEEDFLEAMRGPAGADGKSLTNRGDWEPTTYHPNDYVFAEGTESPESIWFLNSTVDYISMVPPNLDLSHWTEFASEQGPPGEDGQDGTDGINGSLWYIDEGTPASGVGAVNDCYLNITNGDVYQKTVDGWGSPLGTLSGGGTVTPTYPEVQSKTGTATTAVLADAGKYSRFTNASAKTFTFDGNTAYVLGSEFHGRNVGAGSLTLAVLNSFVINVPAGGTLVVPQGGTFTLKIVGAKEADLIGYTVAA